MRPSDGASAVVYVGSADSSEVRVLSLDGASGALAEVQTVPIPGVEAPGTSTPMAVSPDRRFLYVVTRGQPQVAAGFRIDPASGRLTHVASGPLADSLPYIATDRTGRYLLGASYSGHAVTVNPIGPPGTVQPPCQVLSGFPNAHAILADPGNRHVLVPTLGDDRVNRFDFDAAAGRLWPDRPPATAVPPNAGPRHLRFHPDGRRVYVLGELDGTVYAFDYDGDTGQLRATQEVSALPPGFQGRPAAADLHVTPDGRFLYASVRATSTLAGFRIDPATGALDAIGSVATEAQPRGFGIDESGRFLLVAGQRSHRLSSYRIDPEDGTLTVVAQQAMGRNPNWVEIVDLS